ncbi:thiamine phosphate phosphatase / amino-HMP aminohydrolase [Alternaria panax]|uniref:Thiamine phosphate phosphatase / amino-HMP aminohydrolase n=1 Tax=Alternaria panax TaxID=48097 RepID=A0AAD4NUP5_9PLEO|nr:thiamine phosphate phosphatase / amino-HMP aminohydrolase [Alternaria panax]
MSTCAKSLFDKASPIHWILDWDGTITRKDTLDALVSISAATKPAFPTQDRWNHVSKAYMDDYITTLAQVAPHGELPTTVSGEAHLLAQMKPVEQRSLDRVSSSGIFAGLTREALEAGARQAIDSRAVNLRNGFSGFFKYIHDDRKKDGVVILSVNWSRYFIKSCLGASSINHVPADFIYSNELDKIDSREQSTGIIVPATNNGGSLITSSGDKLERMERMQDLEGQRVYVGDSWTDIECLLAADLGVCVRDDPMGTSQKKLAEALTRLGVSCPRLKDYREAGESRVVWVRDFAEIQEWVESKSTSSCIVK